MGSVAKSYMRKGFLIDGEMHKYLTIYDLAKRSWTTGAALAIQASISPVLPLPSLMFTSNEEIAGPMLKKVVFNEMSPDQLENRLVVRGEAFLRPPLTPFCSRLLNCS
jgi:hypothetical protein